MRRILSKLPLLLCGILLMSINGSLSAADVTILLLMVSLSSVNQWADSRRILLITALVYFAACLAEPVFLYFLPLFLSDIVYQKAYRISLLALPVMLWNIQKLSPSEWIILLTGILFSVLFSFYLKKLEHLEQLYREERDKSVEQQTSLQMRNRQLLENQDNEIRMAMLKERNRIAREIHDNVGHMLSRSILQTAALQVMQKDDLQKAALQQLGNTLDQAMTTIRQSVHDLHDESIDFRKILEESVQPLTNQGIIVRHEFDFSERVPSKMMYSIVAMVKEGVSNIVRHSNATEAQISFLEHPGFYQLTIQDNGSGSKPDFSNGIGLSNMQERMEALGGIIDISADEKGFRIFASVRKEQISR